MTNLFRQLSLARDWLSETFSNMSIRRDRAVINSPEALFVFVSTRSALIAQKKLYGYLKERIGLRYPEAFQDDAFAHSIAIARMEVFAASLADMTVHAVARTTAGSAMSREARAQMAAACFGAGLDDNSQAIRREHSSRGWIDRFRDRAAATNWESVAAGGSAFVESPAALVRWAPISDEHKMYDREIVENSIRYAWNEIAAELSARLDAASVQANWRRSGSDGQ